MSSEYKHINYGASIANQMEYVAPRRRMNISDEVFLPDHIWDTRTGRVIPQQQPDPRRQRVQAATIELNQLNEKEDRMRKWAEMGLLGKRINLSTALLVMMSLFFLLGMFTISHRSTLQDWNDKYEIAMRGVSQIREENELIQSRIDDAKQEEDISYRAANDLGMIRAGDAQTIPLNAVDAYPVQSVSSGYTAEVVTVTGWGEAQPTQMPVTANAEQ